MALDDIFNLENFLIGDLVKYLYNPESLGGISIPGFMKEDFRKLLSSEIKNLDFEKVRQQEGLVKEGYERVYINFDNPEELREYPLIQLLVSEYSQIYKEFSRLATFKGMINTVGVHRYNANDIGITPHIDHIKEGVNLISIFCVEGEAEFCVCKDKSKVGSVKLDSSLCSLILLRAPRTNEEKKLRPTHYIGNIKREKLSLMLRQQP